MHGTASYSSRRDKVTHKKSHPQLGKLFFSQ